MFEKLVLTNSNGEVVEFSQESPYFATEVGGISDITSALYTSESMYQHGESLIGVKISSRDIDISGLINKVDKNESLVYRRKLARVLNPELDAILVYSYGDFSKSIRVRSKNAPIFKDKNNRVEFDVNLHACDPFWRDTSELAQDIASWMALFHFPLEIPVDEGIMFGQRQPSLIVDVFNEGDVSTGMRIVFRASGTVVNPSLLNIDTREEMKLNVRMNAGDEITINTEYGSKAVTCLRNDEVLNYFRFIDVDSTFMQLAIGDNLFKYDAEEGNELLECTIYYSNKYLGV